MEKVAATLKAAYLLKQKDVLEKSFKVSNRATKNCPSFVSDRTNQTVYDNQFAECYE